MSESVPAWKKAIYDRKKQQQKEEELKLAEEDVYLATLPPWKRSLFLKKKDDAAKQQPQQTNKVTSKQPSSSGSFAAQKSPSKVAAATTNSSAAANATVGAHTRPSAASTKASTQVPAKSAPVTNSNNNSSSGGSAVPIPQPTKTAALTSSTPPLLNSNVPLWKRNLLEKQNAPKPAANEQREQPTAKKAEIAPQSFPGSSKPPLSKPPAEKAPSVQVNKVTSASPRRVDSSPSKPVAARCTTDSTNMANNDRETSSTAKKQPLDEYSEARLAGLPQWKRDLILRKKESAVKEKEKHITAAREEVTPKVQPLPKVTRRQSIDKDLGWQLRVKADGEVKKAKTLVKRISSEKLSVWKRKEKSGEVEPVKPVTIAQPEPQHQAVVQEQDKPVEAQKISSTAQNSKPVVVNSSEKKEIEPESNVVAPPIINEVDQWANVTEDDAQFKALPAWRQAMVLRRRNDIRRRSNPDSSDILDISAADTSEAEQLQSQDDETDMPEWKREMLSKKTKKGQQQDEESSVQADAIWDMDPDMPEWKKEAMLEKMKEKKRGSLQDKKSHSVPLLAKANPKPAPIDADIPEWKKEAMQKKSQDQSESIPEWKKEATRNEASKKSRNQDSIPEWKKEAMNRQAANKTQTSDHNTTTATTTPKKKPQDGGEPILTKIRPLSPPDPNSTPLVNGIHEVGKPPSFDDDDDEDDIPCTNIDDISSDDSDVGGSGSYDINPAAGQRQGSASSGYASDTTSTKLRPQRSSKSILVVSKKRSISKTRRISWDESHIEKEHSYPKYDYTDYDDFNEAEENGKTNEDSVFSHPIHPSLGFANGSAKASSSSNLSSYQPAILSSYSVTASSSSYNSSNKKPAPKAKPEPTLPEEPEFNMSNLSDDVAALLF